jgi:transposase
MEKELKYEPRKLSPKGQEELRKKIVRKMKKVADARVVAEICECSLRHVHSTWKRYQDGGIDAVKAVQMGRPKGSGCKLTPEQQAKIKRLIVEKDPNQLKLVGFLWDRKLVCELVRRQFGITMPVRTMGEYLSRWGFTAQRPKKKHYKQSETAVKNWLETEYPEIERNAKAEKAEIFWVDETGVANTSYYVKGYAPRGKTPTVPVASEHIRVNMISAITNQGKVRFRFYREKLNQELYIDFLKRLMRGTERKVYAIADNLKVHHGLILQDWARANAEKISLYYLPSYAPQLNPDEYLNNNLKHEIAKKGYSENADEIEAKALGTMRSIQATKGRVTSFFQHDSVKYADGSSRKTKLPE